MTLEYGVVKFFGVITLHFFFFADAKCTLNCILYCNENQQKNGRGKKKNTQPQCAAYFMFLVFPLNYK